MPRVLVCGGSGYLGQFLVGQLPGKGFPRTEYTYASRPLPASTIGAAGHKVDFASGEGLAELFEQHGPYHAVVNCVAVSQPIVCEKDPEVARAINVPTSLLSALQQQQARTGIEALLIHVSTDQVYDGGHAFWSEDDDCAPVNAYGRSKLEAERFIQARWPRHVILRSSIIVGPQPPHPVPRALFMQFVDGALAKGEPTTFFEDEFRCPVYVDDIVTVVAQLLSACVGCNGEGGDGRGGLPPHTVYNLGGPERLSRVDMALKVAACRGHDASLVKAVPSASVNRGVASPADISMSMERLTRDLQVTLTPLSQALKHVFSGQ